MCKFIGIDISKQVFDVSFLLNDTWKHAVLENGKLGFKKLLKLIGEEDVVVMEASGTYYLPLAEFLFNDEKLSTSLRKRMLFFSFHSLTEQSIDRQNKRFSTNRKLILNKIINKFVKYKVITLFVCCSFSHRKLP